jgi:hypothetical protein
MCHGARQRRQEVYLRRRYNKWAITLVGCKWALFFQRATRLDSSSSSQVDRGLCLSVLFPRRAAAALVSLIMSDAAAALSGTTPPSCFSFLALPPISIDWILRVAWQLGARCKLSWKPPAPATSTLSRVRRPVPSSSHAYIPSTLSKRLPAELVAALDEEDKGAAAVAAAVRDANKRTALHFAARQGRTDVCAFLIDELGLPVDPEDDDGTYAPLFISPKHATAC